MPIREESFRIGCGRYLQQKGVVSKLGEEIKRIGSAPLIVGGKTALTITREKIEKSVSALCEKYEIVKHCGTCNEERAKELGEFAKTNGYDVVVGVGGGVIMDFAKLIGDIGCIPVINVPTSSATCAAYTPLSVRYTPDGRTVGSKHYGYEVGGVLVDTEIIATQPIRLLLAGVFDALAKFVEIKQRFDDETTEYPIGLDWAYILSKKSFEELNRKTEQCISDMCSGEISDTVEQVIFTTIAVTGVISGIARGSNQCALAHKFYESTRKIFFEESRNYLHGEIVGLGLLLQNHFNGDAEKNIILSEFMKKYNMPSCLSEIGVSANFANKVYYFEELKRSSAINENDPEELEKLEEALEYLWRLDCFRGEYDK